MVKKKSAQTLRAVGMSVSNFSGFPALVSLFCSSGGNWVSVSGCCRCEHLHWVWKDLTQKIQGELYWSEERKSRSQWHMSSDRTQNRIEKMPFLSYHMEILSNFKIKEEVHLLLCHYRWCSSDKTPSHQEESNILSVIHSYKQLLLCSFGTRHFLPPLSLSGCHNLWSWHKSSRFGPEKLGHELLVLSFRKSFGL